MILAIAVGIFADMRIDQPGLVSDHFGIAVLQLYVPALCRLDLGSGQFDARLDVVRQIIVVSSLPVVAENFDPGVHLQFDLNA